MGGLVSAGHRQLLAFGARPAHSRAMNGIDPTDYSVVVKHRAKPPKPWRWEIYRAGRSGPIEQSSVYFKTMVTAGKAGKEALKQLLGRLDA